ncbi:MAG: rhodanese-like domain-containing protein [Desulfobacterales bacterium]|jgi:rhodanese-related sulfurtransferase
MRYKIIGALTAILAAAGLLMLRQPTIEARLSAMQPELDAQLIARTVQIDPGELLGLIYNYNTALRIIDVRNEADFNLFHIIDSHHASLEQIRDPGWVKRLPQQTVFVLVSNDEKRATQAWKFLSANAVKNIYILEGGINYWLDLYGQESLEKIPTEQAAPKPVKDDTLRHQFMFALGGQHPASDPDPKQGLKRKYVKKVKPIGRVAKKTGGCG